MKKIVKAILMICGALLILLLIIGGLLNLWYFNTWPTYTNQKYGYQIKYPKGWTLTDEKDYGVTIRAIDENVVCSITGMESGGSWYSAKEFHDDVFSDTTDEWVNETNLVKRESFTPSSGQTAEETITENKNSNATKQSVITINDGILTDLSCFYSDLDERKGYEIFFNKMKKSLTISDDLLEPSKAALKKTVTTFMKATLGTIPGAAVDETLARSLLVPKLQKEFDAPGFITQSYGIQDGPDEVKIETVIEKDNIGMVIIAALYGGKKQVQWDFSLENNSGDWLIDNIYPIPE